MVKICEVSGDLFKNYREIGGAWESGRKRVTFLFRYFPEYGNVFLYLRATGFPNADLMVGIKKEEIGKYTLPVGEVKMFYLGPLEDVKGKEITVYLLEEGA